MCLQEWEVDLQGDQQEARIGGVRLGEAVDYWEVGELSGVS